VLDPKQWPEEIQNHLKFGEREINLSARLLLNEREMIQSSREYLEEKRIPEKLFKLIYNVDMIPIPSSECERGFSQMNLTVTPFRSLLLTKTTSVVMFIKIVGPPLSQFDPTKFVESWLFLGHHSAIDTKSKDINRDIEHPEGMTQIWSFL
jgi:hypothetical protein